MSPEILQQAVPPDDGTDIAPATDTAPVSTAEPPVPGETPAAPPVDPDEQMVREVADELFQQQKEQPDAFQQRLDGWGIGFLTAPSDFIGGVAASMASGAAKSVFETKDTISGMFGNEPPKWEDKWAIRTWIESGQAQRERDSTVNGIARSLTQFGVGWLGLGKFAAIGKAALGGSRAARVAVEVGRGATVGAVAFDPYEDRLSNFVEAYPSLSNPVTTYLAANPTDSRAEARFKSALESVGLDLTLGGALIAATKFIKAKRAGDTDAAIKFDEEARELFRKAAEKGDVAEAQRAATAPRSTAADTPVEARQVVQREQFDEPRERAAGFKDRMSPQHRPGSSDPLQDFVQPPPTVGEATIPPRTPPSSATPSTPQPTAAPRAAPVEPPGATGGTTRGVNDAPPVASPYEEVVGQFPKRGVAPANLGADGKLYVGSPNSLHFTISEKFAPEVRKNLGLEPGDATWKSEGFVTPDGQYLNRREAFDWVEANEKRIKSSDNMEPRELDALDYYEQVPEGRRAAGATSSDSAPLKITVRPQRFDPERLPSLTPDEVTRALDKTQREVTILDDAGGMENAIANGYRPPRDDLIPWQKMNTQDEVSALVDSIAVVKRDYYNKLRGGDAEGILSDVKVNRMVTAMAEDFNEAPATVIGRLQAAGRAAKDMVAHMEVAYSLAKRMYNDTYALAVRLKNENFEGYGSRGEALAALQKRLGLATNMMGEALAIRAAGGRIVRRNRSEFGNLEAQLAHISTHNPDELLDLILQTGGAPKALSKLGRMTLSQRIFDKVSGLYAGNLLMGWKTQVINAVTSATQLAWRPLEKGLGAGFLELTGKVIGKDDMAAKFRDIRVQSQREIVYTGASIADATGMATQAFLRGDSILAPHMTEALTGVSQRGIGTLTEGFKKIEDIWDVGFNALIASDKVLTGSLRFLGAADEMVKQARYRAVVLSKASVEADHLGLKRGSKDYKAHLSKRLSESTDDVGRATDSDALQEALEATWQHKLPGKGDTWLGPVAASWQNFAQANPLTRLITPFIRTPTNLFRHGVKLTPGLNLLQKEYARAISGALGAERQAQATGQMMLGILLASSAATLWASGRLTGGGPQNPQHAREWRGQGNRPWSFTWEDEKGVKNFLEVSRLDPIFNPMLLTAEILSLVHTGQEHVTPAEQRGYELAAVMSFMHLVKDKTALRNVSVALQAINDPDGLKYFAKSTAPGFMPFSMLMRDANQDQLARETWNWLDAAKARIPGMSDTLPPQHDFTGEPIMAATGFTNYARHQGPLNDALDDIFKATGVYPTNARPTRNHVDLREVVLESSGKTAYSRLQELQRQPQKGMPTMRDALTKLVTSKQYEKLPHGHSDTQGTKAWALQRIVGEYREAAFKRLMQEDEGFRAKMHEQRVNAAGAIKGDPRAAAGVAASRDLYNLLGAFGLGGSR